METVQNFIATRLFSLRLSHIGGTLVYGATKPYNWCLCEEEEGGGEGEKERQPVKTSPLA